MMKNLLMTAALAAVAMTASAQGLVANSPVKADLQKKTLTLAADVKNFQVSKAAPLKSPSTGVGFGRPEGTFYSGYAFGEAGDMSALMVPAIAEVTYKHYCYNTPSWSIDGQSLDESTDGEGNLVMSWSTPTGENNYAGYYAPILTASGEDFSLTDVTMTGNDFLPVTPANPIKVKTYTGFQDGPAWGSGSVLEQVICEQVEGAQPVGMMQAFEKPIVPMCVKDMTMMFWTESENPLAGNTLTVGIYELDEEGEFIDASNPNVTLTCNEVGEMRQFSNGDGSYGTLTFANFVEDDIFGVVDEPFVVDYPYAIIIMGYNEPGVDVRFFLNDQGDDENELPFAQPTRVATVVDGETKYYYWASVEKGYCYNVALDFDVMYDYVDIVTEGTFSDGSHYENMNRIHISADGKTVSYESSPEEGDAYLQAYTVLPIGSDDSGYNYELEGCPEWLTFGVDDSYFKEYGVNIFTPQAEALPEGVDGRTAVVYITSTKGAKSQPIYIAQGNATAINAVNADKQNSAIYNLAGQAVKNATKGVFIQNGKKFVK